MIITSEFTIPIRLALCFNRDISKGEGEMGIMQNIKLDKEFPGDANGTNMMVVTYYAINGDVYETKAIWYRIQEALNYLSQIAYENHTSVESVLIH